MLLQGRLAPSRAIFPAAADVGHHVTPPAQPGAAQDAAIVRLQRHLEAAVAGEQGGEGDVSLQALGGHLEIWDPGAILGTGEVLGQFEAGLVEEGP